MLFGYPIAATAENWFHECLYLILHDTNSALLNDEPVPAWAEMFPEEFREKIVAKGAFEARLLAYQTAAETLTVDELNRVTQALSEQNKIIGLLAGECNCDKLSDLPASIREPIKDLYEIGFKLLTRLEIRDRQYAIIYKSLPSPICPFCGLEYFPKPGIPRRHLDHYLVEKSYTFAATNLYNLVPMGSDCNSMHKNQKDILYEDDGTRRTAYYPYNDFAVQVSLLGSVPFEGADELGKPIPQWKIDFIPDTVETRTWDCVFDIKKRYEDVLEAKFSKWIAKFGEWCAESRPIQDVMSELEEYTNLQLRLKELDIGNQQFLETAVFEMLLHHCQSGDERLINFLSKVANGET